MKWNKAKQRRRKKRKIIHYSRAANWLRGFIGGYSWWNLSGVRRVFLRGKGWMLVRDYSGDCCPCCGWLPPDEGGNVKYSKKTNYYSPNGSGSSWIESWICDDCGTEFKVEDGT